MTPRTKLKKFVEPKVHVCTYVDWDGRPEMKFLECMAIETKDWLRTMRHMRRLEKMVGVKS